MKLGSIVNLKQNFSVWSNWNQDHWSKFQFLRTTFTFKLVIYAVQMESIDSLAYTLLASKALVVQWLVAQLLLACSLLATHSVVARLLAAQ